MRAALLVVDVLNDYEHDDAEPLMAAMAPVVPVIRELVSTARATGAPVVYVNDHHGDWAAGPGDIVACAREGRAPQLVDPLVPEAGTPFLRKARHSAFYATALEHLLRQEDVGRVVLTGQVTEQCILYSALDAYVRHLAVTVPREAVAHIDEELAAAALRMMAANMDAEVVDVDAARRRLAEEGTAAPTGIGERT